MRTKKYCLSFTVYCSLLYILLLTSHFSLLTFFTACGRRGDPVAIEPYKEVGIVRDLKASVRDDGIYLTWGMPRDKDFPMEAVKGFVVFRAEIPEGVSVEECECQYRSLDFIKPDGKKVLEYLDKKAIKGQAYVYKSVVMDKNSRIGKDSNIVLVTSEKPDTEKIEAAPTKDINEALRPKAPSGLTAIYTQKAIVLTWDEVHEGKLYRVYRSTPINRDRFILIGEALTPVFTDKNVEPSKKYYYRVTIVREAGGGVTESVSSNVIEVVTEVR